MCRARFSAVLSSIGQVRWIPNKVGLFKGPIPAAILLRTQFLLVRIVSLLPFCFFPYTVPINEMA